MDPVAVGFQGSAGRMAAADLAAEALGHGYELAVIQAVLSVESSGAGFDDQRRPKILTEPHIFYRQLAGQPEKLAEAVRQGIAYPVWGQQPYPRTSELNYVRLKAMCAIDTPAALSSASWGIGQVMGFNHAACGFATVDAMVQAAMDSERSQFDFLISYAEHAGLGPALRTKNWTAFARGYNGPGAVVSYAAKLAAAYQRYRAAPAVSVPAPAPTPVRPAQPVPVVPSPADADPPGLTTDQLNDREWLRIRAGLAT